MKQFMLLLREDLGLFDKYSPAEMQQIIQEYAQWGKTMAEKGKMAGGHQLDGEPVTIVKNNDQILTDGPLTELKEVIGGYYILATADMDEAVELSKTCPHLKFGGKIDIRELVIHG